MKVLGFDLGAGSGRAVLGNYELGKLHLEEIYRFENEPIMQGDTLCWDIEQLFFEVIQALKICVELGHSDLSSIAIDTWGVDFGLFDQEGKMLFNPIHYRDQSHNEVLMSRVLEQLGKSWLYQKTGIQMMPFNTIFQLAALKENKLELLKKAHRLLFMPDILNYMLTGKMATEYTIASTSGLLNVHTKNWDFEIITALGINPNLFLPIEQPGTSLDVLSSSVQTQTGLGPITVQLTTSHDTASAVVAVPFASKQSAFISSGTWSLIGLEIDKPILSDDIDSMTYTNEGGFGNTIRYLKNVNGLWILQEVKKCWQQDGQWQTYEVLESAISDAKANICFIDPDETTFSSPGNMVTKIHQYLIKSNQSIPKTQAELARSLLESLAKTYHCWLKRLEQQLNIKLEVIHLVGGGGNSKNLCQFTADATGLKVHVGPIEATVSGNILVQLIGAGVIKDMEAGRLIIKNSMTIDTYTPTNHILKINSLNIETEKKHTT